MLYAVIASASERASSIRDQVRPAHMEYLGPFNASGTIVIGGPFTDGSGHLIIVDVNNEGEAAEFARNDPYYKEGVVARFEIKPFRKVLPK